MINIQCPDTPMFRHAAMDFLASDIAAMDLTITATPKNIPAIDKTPAAIYEPLEADDTSDEAIGSDFICPITGERLDIEGGYPWDSRIHGEKKSKLAKTGRWKPLRGIEIKSPGLTEKIEKEFDERRATTTNTMKQPETVLPATVAKFTPPPPPQLVKTLPSMPAAPAFNDIVSYVTSRVAVNPAYQECVDDIVASFSLSDITQLMDHTPEVSAAFGQWLVHTWNELESK